MEGDIEATKRLIRRDSKKDLINLLATVHVFFGQALWMLEKLSHAVMVDAELEPLWQNVRIGLKWSTLQLIDGRLREILKLPEKSVAVSMAERNELMGGKYDYAITDTGMIQALKQLERFSIKGLARLLAPDRDDFRFSVYDWMKRKKITRKDLEQFWSKLRGVDKPDQSSDTVETLH